MKKFLIGLAAVSALLVSCEEKKPESTPNPINLTSFGFLAENNSSVLSSDIVRTTFNGTTATIELPVGTPAESLESLVPTFTTEPGDAAATIGGTVLESGKTTVDFSNPVDIYFSKGEDNAMYTITVKVKEAAKWKLATTTGELRDTLFSAPVMAINHSDGCAYLLGSKAGASSSERYPMLFKFDGTSISHALNDVTATQARSEHFGISFSPDGVPYIGFLDYSVTVPDGNGGEKVSQAVSVMKVENGKATYVGNKGGIFVCKNPVAIIPAAENDIWVAEQNDNRNANIERRTLNLAKFNGSEWTNENAMPGRDASHYAYYTLTKYFNGEYYLLVYNQNDISISIYKYAGNTWTTVCEAMKINKIDGTPVEEIYVYSVCFDIASDGNFYILAGCPFISETYNVAVIRYDPEDKSQTIIGGVMTDMDMSKHKYFSLALDNTNTPYVAFANEDDNDRAYVRYLDNKTKSWTSPVAISSESIKDAPAMVFNADGQGFMSILNCGNDVDGVYEVYMTE